MSFVLYVCAIRKYREEEKEKEEKNNHRFRVSTQFIHPALSLLLVCFWCIDPRLFPVVGIRKEEPDRDLDMSSLRQQGQSFVGSA